ncbi:MAG TPA: hypothetical protein VEX18_06950, partial [Polyangiaceae bacterium]|nr:hypothetical protein [Polyangiaceae bacterium]
MTRGWRQGLAAGALGHYAAPVLLFNTLAYAIFFGVVFVVSWFMARHTRLRLWFLLLASYYFYAQWDWRFLGLIFASSTVDWLLGNAIAGAST